MKYEEIGLSLGEKEMRRKSREMAMDAKTVAEALKATEGNYFTAHFIIPGQDKSYSEPDNRKDINNLEMEVWQRKGEASDNCWTNTGQMEVINPNWAVMYTGSGEDIHEFEVILPK